MANIGTYIKAENLSPDLLSRMDALSINAGSRFLSGQISSAFATVNNAKNAGIMAVNTAKQIPQITKELVEHSLTVIQNELKSYISDKTSELTDFKGMTSILTYSIAYHTKANTMTTKEILEKISTKNVQNESKKRIQKQQKEELENIKKDLNETVGNINDYIKKANESLNNGISSITAYIANGPTWVVNTVNSYVAQIIDKAQGFIGDKANFAIENRDKAIDSLGKTIGMATANTINELAINVAKKQKADVEDKISKVQTKALNALTKAVMIVRQLTGIAIPPTYPKLPKLKSLFG